VTAAARPATRADIRALSITLGKAFFDDDWSGLGRWMSRRKLPSIARIEGSLRLLAGKVG